MSCSPAVCDIPREVEEPETIDVLLVLRGHCHTATDPVSEPVVFATDGTMCVQVNGALHVARGEEREGITRVDSKGAILRLHPAPFPSRVVSNLESRHRLAEEKSEGAQI